MRVLRKRSEQPTAAEVQEHEISGHEPYRSWCRASVSGRGRADAHVGRQGVEKGVPVIGVDYGYFWSRAPEASDPPHDEVAGEDSPDGVRNSSPVLCGWCSVVRWLFGHLCQASGDNERNRDGERALLAHVRAARVMTMVSGVPLESMGLGRRIPETHDSLAWLVTHAAATINWFRPGLDGKTPYELRMGRKFRRPVAPWELKIWWVSAKKHVSRICAESRWQERIFLGIFGGGVGASDYAIGTPDGVQPARAIMMV